ncbi:HPF/RaiA family ribosome-associated protein [Streptacidiphilus pinicola]|uniref:HPF/RaiA family ribosome-associated protein n=1 Tax=Streptacidiphilus pinicola TaxID=2219663 RepID=A0A2X0IE72_9ACTN|nr:sigma 54 modulation/S30EA ribosomal C-terminal domain-containing protein [Streptacidiphilus pinicola]RAG81923.1 HPF/RaiA family ribosome-associated protein [Streptacidiphilus pinicola]
MDREDRPQELPELQLLVTGDLSPVTGDLARTTVQEVLDEARRPVRSARVRLARMPQREGRPAVAQVLVDVDGELVRVQVAAQTMTDAISLLARRLAVQLGRLEWARSHDLTEADDESGTLEWRDGAEAARRPLRADVPSAERSLVRRKDYRLARESVDEAALTMETMDFDFHLFTETGSGQDSVIYRFSPGPFRLAQLEPAEGVTARRVPVNVLTTAAPVLTEDEARARLGATDYPFLFFKDAETGRGSVLYGRYDGHYGLITAVSADRAPEAATPFAAATDAGTSLESSLRDRVSALESQVAALAEILDRLTAGLEAVPGAPEDPEEVRRSARLAKELLLAAGFRR